ncbi:MAG: hydantoinase/oxoprolinase family protein [Candidatus Eremiobacteraeota bacterium]|nr:hydantoinase/oxoprolinase family protein [Candidatus Eremiobacteraeota bacterium]
MSRLRVGIDVGGTFTDLVAFDDRNGELTRIKVPSTPRNPEEGVVDALARLLRDAKPGDIALLSHSSTVATNALLGQINLELPRTVLLTTEGFRDVIEIGRQNRAEVYNLFVKRPRPLVARHDRIGVRERMDPFGDVVAKLDSASLAAALDAIAAADARAVAVSYLHAYANDAHERATGEAIRKRFPDVPVSLSSEVDPEYREYERTSTTVVNAMLGPLVRAYLERLWARARGLGIVAPFYVMQSNGGMAALEVVAEKPATTIESGPASGVIGAAFLGRELGIENVLSFDMGGTTAKAGTIVGGEPQIANEFEAAGKSHSGRAVKGSGYPVRFPFVDLAEVSAGGGTIAFVDAGGALRVGPLSAGADPGPAAYGNGLQPTVTDANIVLGRLNPRALLGGAMKIDAARSRAALEALLPELPELDLDRLAAGIVRLVDTEMAKILRIVTVERGHDPRLFALMAFGGGGPLHACALAEELSVPEVIVPVDPGLFSAFGLLAADVRATSVRSLVALAEGVPPATVEAAFEELESRGRRDLSRQRVEKRAISFVRELDVRYLGQSFELTIGVSEPYDAAAGRAAMQRFHERHERTYGYASPDEPVEIVAVRSTAIGAVRKPALPRAARRATAAPADGALLETRDAYVDGGRRSTPVFARAALRAGNEIAGPALVEQYDSCTLIAPGWHARIDDYGNIRMRRV